MGLTNELRLEEGYRQALQVQAAPYLYRTACARMEESARGQRAADRLLSLERQRIERGLVKAIGWRCVARARVDADGPVTHRSPPAVTPE